MPEVSVSTLIDQLIDVNTSVLDKFAGLLGKMQEDVVSNGAGLQGEVEELLRVILQIANESIVAALSLQEQLQTRIVESYFPAQD